MTLNSEDKITLSRRTLLKASVLAGGGFLLNVTLPAGADESQPLVRSRELNVYVQIDPDGEITIYSAIPEMGQGIKTSLPMIIAEEMGARWEDVTVIDAPLDSKYGMQGAGGSTSIPRNMQEMRKVGASAREMLIGAAALLMEVESEELEAKDSRVIHRSGESRSFGQLATLAAQQPVPDAQYLSYKDPRAYTIIGTSVGSVDNLVIATGQSSFGIDVDVPGMKYATYTRCPRVGGVAIKFNEKEIKAMPGVVDAFIVAPDDRSGRAQMAFLEGLAVLRGGVAIIGDDTWSVMDAKSQLAVQWDDSEASQDSWTDMVAQAKALSLEDEGTVSLDGKSVDAELSNGDNKVLEAFYQFPYVAHVCMEPMNCTAHFQQGRDGMPDTFEIWLGSQFPGQVKEIVKNLFDMAPENVTVHPQRMGGGFGRRAVHDYAAEALTIAHRCAYPVKLTWTRTDDIHNDFFRVGGFENMKAALDKEGKLKAWDQHYIGFAKNGRPVIGSGLRGNELPAVCFENARVRQSMLPVDTPCGAWRAPGSNTNAFVEQSFIHELAEAAGRDHVEFLLELLGEPRWITEGNVSAIHTGRAADVIRRVASEAGWGKEMGPGRGMGLSFYFCHAAHVAEIAEVSVNDDKTFSVDRVTVAVDVGPIISRSGALNQVQGSVVDGLSTMAAQQITVEGGVIQQANFNDYSVMRLGATPQIEVHFIESDNPSTGLGEPALPPLAPAVTNAIYSANGDRVRIMPLTEAGYRLM